MITEQHISTLEEPMGMNNAECSAELIAAIEEARAEIAQGKFVTFEEIKKEFSSWVAKND